MTDFVIAAKATLNVGDLIAIPGTHKRSFVHISDITVKRGYTMVGYSAFDVLWHRNGETVEGVTVANVRAYGVDARSFIEQYFSPNKLQFLCATLKEPAPLKSCFVENAELEHH